MFDPFNSESADLLNLRKNFLDNARATFHCLIFTGIECVMSLYKFLSKIENRKFKRTVT